VSDLFTVRYPSGETEFRMRDNEPQVGDVLTRNGDNWVVEAVTEAENGSTLVTLRPGHEDQPE
jgi:hypothetical protein